MANSYTEVTRQSWGDRLKDSLRGAVIGLLLFIGAFPLLFWNEGRAVHRAQALEEGEKVVNSIDANTVDWVYDDTLVHISGKAITDESLTDSEFGLVATQAIKLRRVVEMYQWDEIEHSETREEFGGSTETITTYSYSKTWSEDLIDSGRFKQLQGHHNPSYLAVSSKNWNAKQVKLGKFILSPSLVSKLNNYQAFPITTDAFEQLQKENGANLHGQKIQLSYGSYYVGQEPNDPQIGDLRIKFEFVRPTIISVIAKQVGSNTGPRLTPYMTKAGGEIELFEEGTVMANEMFERAKLENTLLSWFLRAVGCFMMFIGLSLIFEVLKILAAVVPALGNVVGVLGGLVALFIALILTLVIIGVAWLYYRPLLGISLFVTAGCILYFLMFLRQPREPRFAPQESTPPPPPKDPNLIPEIMVPEK